MRHIESDLQRACVRWFRLKYHYMEEMLFAVPNGGSRNYREASFLKMEGVKPGVADLILLVGRHGYGSLCVELKTRDGRLSKRQQEWGEAALQNGNKYVVCRSVEEFICEIDGYLK